MNKNRGPRSRIIVPLVAILSISTSGAAQESADLHDHAALHAAAGLEAAELSPGHVNLCDLNMTFRNVNRLKSDPPRPDSSETARSSTGNASRRQSPPVAPMQVFDNLYFVGNAGVSAWLLGNDEGYFLIDAMNTDEDAKSTIEAGILELGLDPSRIQYLLITHAHGDHYGGYQYIQKTYNPRIVMSETDWELASQLQEHPRFGAPPAKDLSVRDGDRLTAGTTSIEIFVTPGHTMGTVSPVFTVLDNGEPFTAVLWGGTGFNFGPNHDQMTAYAASARRMKEYALANDVQVFLANHPRRDGALDKMQRLSERNPDDPHPFVDESMALAAFEVLGQCALAQADRIQAGDL